MLLQSKAAGAAHSMMSLVRACAVPIVWLILGAMPAVQAAQVPSAAGSPRPRVHLDCASCFDDYLREATPLVDYVRDRSEADVHAIVVPADTAGGGREWSVSLIGRGRFKGADFRTRAFTISGETEDTQRRRLVTAITIGLLNYLSLDGVRDDLSVAVARAGPGSPPRAGADPWHQWVLSLQGSVALAGEEASRQLDLGAEVGADRITDAWKVTVGVELEQRREDFDLDEGARVRARRHERDLDALIAWSASDHWSIGGRLSVDSTSFDNIALRVFGGPAVEYNVFPYTQYARRQLRLGYAIGPYRARYAEETLFGTQLDRLVRQQALVALDQREPWGSLQLELDVSAFLTQPSQNRLQLEADAQLRIARGLSLSVEASATRSRDQRSLPRRGVTAEEVLLRLRRLRSGYEYGLEVGVTYTFGSIFSPVVNPRFGH